MFGDIGWAELMLIGIVALLVIGPEQLPDMFRQIGRFTAKLRQMSREFSRAMEQAAKESGIKDVADDLKSATSSKSMGLNKVKAAADRFEKWDPLKPAVNAASPKPLVPAPMPATPAAAAPEPTAAPEPSIMGAETKALAAKQAAKKAILAETAAKLKAVDAGEFSAHADQAAPSGASKPKPRAKKPASAGAAPIAKAAPKVTRKPEKADEA